MSCNDPENLGRFNLRKERYRETDLGFLNPPYYHPIRAIVSGQHTPNGQNSTQPLQSQYVLDCFPFLIPVFVFDSRQAGHDRFKAGGYDGNSRFPDWRIANTELGKAPVGYTPSLTRRLSRGCRGWNRPIEHDMERLEVFTICQHRDHRPNARRWPWPHDGWVRSAEL